MNSVYIRKFRRFDIFCTRFSFDVTISRMARQTLVRLGRETWTSSVIKKFVTFVWRHLYMLIDFYYTRKIVADNHTLGGDGGLSYIIYLLLKKESLNLNTHYLFIQRGLGWSYVINKLVENCVLDKEMSKDEYFFVSFKIIYSSSSFVHVLHST